MDEPLCYASRHLVVCLSERSESCVSSLLISVCVWILCLLTPWNWLLYIRSLSHPVDLLETWKRLNCASSQAAREFLVSEWEDFALPTQSCGSWRCGSSSSDCWNCSTLLAKCGAHGVFPSKDRQKCWPSSLSSLIIIICFFGFSSRGHIASCYALEQRNAWVLTLS